MFYLPTESNLVNENTEIECLSIIIIIVMLHDAMLLNIFFQISNLKDRLFGYESVGPDVTTMKSAEPSKQSVEEIQK